MYPLIPATLQIFCLHFLTLGRFVTCQVTVTLKSIDMLTLHTLYISTYVLKVSVTSNSS